MVAKSHGPRRRTREKFRKFRRNTISRALRNFEVGSNVALVIDSSVHKGMPFRRFQGLTGKVLGKRGRSFIVQIKDGDKVKKVISRPEHLKAV